MRTLRVQPFLHAMAFNTNTKRRRQPRPPGQGRVTSCTTTIHDMSPAGHHHHHHPRHPPPRPHHDLSHVPPPPGCPTTTTTLSRANARGRHLATPTTVSTTTISQTNTRWPHQPLPPPHCPLANKHERAETNVYVCKEWKGRSHSKGWCIAARYVIIFIY
jgi:hypothetical protein